MKYIINQKYILYRSSITILKNKTTKSIYKKAHFFHTQHAAIEKSTKSF